MPRIPAPALTIALLSLLAVSASASTNCVPGDMIINPHGSYYPLPIMLPSPATFNIATLDPQVIIMQPTIVLVMTKASFDGLTAPVLVNWSTGSITFSRLTFTPTSNGYIPPLIPPQTVPDNGRYSVSDLKQHLGVNGTDQDTLYYAYGLFLFGTAQFPQINYTAQYFTVTVPSTNPRVLVLAIGKTPCSSFYNARVKPCMPGFVVPESTSAFFALAAFAALGMYGIRIKRRKH